MIQALLALFGVAGQSVQTYLEGKAIERQTTLEIKKIEAQGRVEQAKALAQMEAEYDNMAQIAMKSSWKDEYLVVILSIPFLLSFATPYIQMLITDYDLMAKLREAWQAVGLAPDWYQWSFLGVVIATFGLRWLTKQGMKDIIKGSS